MNKQEGPISICFVSPKSYPLFNDSITSVFGGAEVDTYLLSTELAKDPLFSVSCITADYGQAASEVRENVRLINGMDFKRNSLANAVRLWKAMRKADSRVYFIECASPGVPLVAAFCRTHRAAFAYRTAHSDECDGTYLRQHRILGKAFAWSLRKADQVVAQNQVDRENLLKSMNVRSDVIANAKRMPTAASAKRDVILWMARSAAFKRPELFLKLVSEMPDRRFLMVCPKATGDTSYEQLQQQAAQLRNLEFVRRVPFGQVDSYFQRARVYVNTSASEGFANTFVDACASGTPILSLQVNPDGFLDEHSCGIACNDDWGKFKSSLVRILDSEIGEQLGNSGKHYAEEHHDISRIAETYKVMFRSLAAKWRLP